MHSRAIIHARLGHFAAALAALVTVSMLASSGCSPDSDGDPLPGPRGSEGSGGSNTTGGLGGMGGSISCPQLTTRDVRPFELQLGSPEGAIGPGGAAGAGGAETEVDLGDSGCVTAPSGPSAVTCEGLAQVTRDDAGPRLALADGSTFSWRLDELDAGSWAEESFVHISYASQNILICPFCGTEPRWTLQVTDATDPERYLLSYASSRKERVHYQAEAMLGVSLGQKALCGEPSTADCHTDVVTTYYDTIVETGEEQRAEYGIPTRITTSLGSFVLIADQFAQDGAFLPDCSDGRGLFYGGSVLVIRR